MSIWTIMNGIAWALCAFIAYLLISDLIKVELQNKRNKKGPDGQAGTTTEKELGGVKDGREEGK